VEEIHSPSKVLPHLSPLYADHLLFWAAIDETNTVRFYQDSPGFPSILTLSSRLDSFAANRTEVWGVTDMGNALWNLLKFPWKP
jgi:hypothetical protein